MPEAEPPFDPDSPVPLGDLKPFTRRRPPLKRYAWPAVAAAAITLGFMLLLGWIASQVISWLG
jgi:hypothetical protein